MFRGIEVETDHVPQLLLKVSVPAQLVVFHPVRSQSSRLPDPAHSGRAHSMDLGHGSSGPVRGVGRLGMQGGVNDCPDGGVRDEQGTSCPRCVIHQRLEATGEEAPSPERAGVGLRAEFFGDGLVGRPLRCAEHDSGAENHSVRGGTPSSPESQSDSFVIGEDDSGSDSHGRGIAHGSYKRSQS